MTDIIEIKKELRKQIRIIKKQYSATQLIELSTDIHLQLENLPAFQDAKTVLMYWSMTDEVYTQSFIEKWSASKRIILPSVKGDDLVLKEFNGVQNLTAGEQFAIPEPEGLPFLDTESIDLIIVPGVAFDKLGNRMGRGRGFYDKLLNTTTAVKIGICFNFQMVENVPVEEHDKKMDFVVSNH